MKQFTQDKGGHQFYFVAAARKDGTTPKLVKAFDDLMFFLPKDAALFAIKKEKELGLQQGVLKVYSAVAYIDEP